MRQEVGGMTNVKSLAMAGMLTIAAAGPAWCQMSPPPPSTLNLSGPRFGVTALSHGVVDRLRREDAIDIGQAVTQFGWQIEKQFYSGRTGGPVAITEAVALIGGLEQGVALPSLSWLVGGRTPAGSEFGVGPNVTPVGVALAVAAGKTFRSGVLNVPVNVAFVPSRSGYRLSVLTGFSLRR
jgi:hypothetical protein